MTFFRRIGVWGNLCLLLGLPHANAATCIWTGAKNGLWSNAANWQDDHAPIHNDSLEFPPEGLNRDTQNDLTGQAYGSITFSGGNYTLRGNRIQLTGGIVSIPGNCTNRIECGLFVNAPQTFICGGYFNQLDLAGRVEVAYPLRLDASYCINISGLITNQVGIVTTKGLAGKLSFGPSGGIAGTLIVEDGTMEMWSQSFSTNFRGSLIVGEEGPSLKSPRVFIGGQSQMVGSVTVNQSGIIYFYGFSHTILSLDGSGAVEIGRYLKVAPPPGTASKFSGNLGGSGTLRLEGEDGGLELSGQNTFSGLIQIAPSWVITNPTSMAGTFVPSRLILSGSASNAAVELLTNSFLLGNGTAKSPTTTRATVQPSPGALRFLESCKLDRDTRLAIALDGPDAGQLRADTIELGDATLEVSYQGTDTASQFTLITASGSRVDSTFQGLPEGSWLIIGNPPHESQITYVANAGHDVVLNYFGAYSSPALAIGPLSATTQFISWPLAAHDFKLQHTDSGYLGGWTTNDLPATGTNSTDQFVIETNSLSRRFYRLIRY